MHKLGLLGAAVLTCATTFSPAASAQPVDAFTHSLSKGPLYAGLTAFLGGLFVCLTPCVYPMIAITVSVFGARQTASRWQAMALSSAFVLGVIAMFAPLGVLAGLTGSLFGAALANRWVMVGVATVFGALAASMLGAFNFVLPGGLTNRLAQIGGIGYLGAFLLGLVSGLIAAPCTGPVLGGILIWIGKTQNPWLGATAMLAFSLGLGLPFWLVGTFAIRLPKGGPWMLAIKTFFGIVLAATALYFLRNAFPGLGTAARPGATFLVVAGAMTVLGVIAALVRPEATRGGAVVRRAAGAVVGAIGLFLLITARELAPTGIEWRSFSPDAVRQARASGHPLLIDFTAEWCAACKELARITFPDKAIVSEASRFECLRVDATNDDDPAAANAQQEFRVTGLPTVLILDRQGHESARITAFTRPAELLPLLEAVR